MSKLSYVRAVRTLLNVSDWADPSFHQILASLRLRSNNHRKTWEFVSIVQLLQERGMLDGTKVGLGLGTGIEPLSFHFANHAREVIATDLFSSDTKWDCARFEPDSVYAASSFPYARERLTFRNMDMTVIDLPDASVDFVWSTSSVEHVSSVEKYLEAFKGIARVLKPGGVAAIVTEWNLLARPDYRPGMIIVDLELLRRVEEATGLRVRGPLDLSVDDDPTLIPFNLDALDTTPFWRHLPNLWASLQGLLFTSARIVFEKVDRPSTLTVAKPLDPALVERNVRIAQQLERTQMRRFAPALKFSRVGNLVEERGAPLLRAKGPSGFLSYGPYVRLFPGRYRVLFDLHCEGQPPRLTRLDVTGTLPGTAPQVLARTWLVNHAKTAGDFTVGLDFDSIHGADHEFRIKVPANSSLGFRGCRLVPEA